MFRAIRFLWNSTRGHRLMPWRSEFLKWRIETFTGAKAEDLTATDVISFLWTTRWEVLSYLAWANDMHREVKRAAKHQA